MRFRGDTVACKERHTEQRDDENPKGTRPQLHLPTRHCNAQYPSIAYQSIDESRQSTEGVRTTEIVLRNIARQCSRGINHGHEQPRLRALYLPAEIKQPEEIEDEMNFTEMKQRWG